MAHQAGGVRALTGTEHCNTAPPRWSSPANPQSRRHRSPRIYVSLPVRLWLETGTKISSGPHPGSLHPSQLLLAARALTTTRPTRPPQTIRFIPAITDCLQEIEGESQSSRQAGLARCLVQTTTASPLAWECLGTWRKRGRRNFKETPTCTLTGQWLLLLVVCHGRYSALAFPCLMVSRQEGRVDARLEEGQRCTKIPWTNGHGWSKDGRV